MSGARFVSGVQGSPRVMMKARIFLIIGVGILLGAVSASAHHSFAAEFDANKPVTLRGTLAKMEWSNPHGWILLNVKGPDGKVVNWAIEAGSPNALIRRGLRPADFAIGSEVIVNGYQAKNGTPTANGTTVKFADGRNFFLGSSGTGAPGDKAGREQ